MHALQIGSAARLARCRRSWGHHPPFGSAATEATAAASFDSADLEEITAAAGSKNGKQHPRELWNSSPGLSQAVLPLTWRCSPSSLPRSDELDAAAIAKSSTKYLSTTRGFVNVKSNRVLPVVSAQLNPGVRQPTRSRAATKELAEPPIEVEGRPESDTVVWACMQALAMLLCKLRQLQTALAQA